MADIVCDYTREDAKILRGTTLYRLVKHAYSDQGSLLNGQGARFAEGRFHYFGQLSSYSSNNALICISEVLFHMYDESLRKLKNNNYQGFYSMASKDMQLVAYQTKEINNLIYLDSSICKQNYQLNPSAITHSDTIYDELRQAVNKARGQQKSGIVVSSARHSKDSVVVLFDDHTNSIDQIDYTFNITLTLMKENLTVDINDSLFDPTRDPISQTIGKYEFDPTEIRQFGGNLYPTIPYEGMLHFSRQMYSNYPQDAVF